MYINPSELPVRLGSSLTSKTVVDPDFAHEEFQYDKPPEAPDSIPMFCPPFPSVHTFKFSKVLMHIIEFIVVKIGILDPCRARRKRHQTP